MIHEDKDKAFIMDSEFINNSAQVGGAIYTDTNNLGGTIISSTFHDNSAERGGAFAGKGKSGKSIQNTFVHNSASLIGSTMLNEGEIFCDGGSNYACSGQSYVSGSCDGIYKDGSCEMFSNVCEYASGMPSMRPTSNPSLVPTLVPSVTPTISSLPSIIPTMIPSNFPTSKPSELPSSTPTVTPSGSPTLTPTENPSQLPSLSPSEKHSHQPSEALTGNPSTFPTLVPSISPTANPSSYPSLSHSEIPSSSPTNYPTINPSETPSDFPSEAPSLAHSTVPTVIHTTKPSVSMMPTISMQPTLRCNMDAEERNIELAQIISGMKKSENSKRQDALKWLSNVDKMYLCPNSEHLIQRYAIAVIVMSLKSFGELSNSHECRWKGIKCNHSGEITEIKLGK